MNRAIGKLVVALMALVLSVVMVVTISYAWMSLSSTPVVEGIQITIGGGNTILVAANLTETVDGVEYNYPAGFRDSLKFSLYDEYDYLNNLAPLSAVSTADGINWFLPERYDINDEEVKSGANMVGELKSISEFRRDDLLQFANLTAEDENADVGHYVYVDFWVVSPGTDYTLRVSKGDNSGSYLLEMMVPEEIEDGYTLVDTSGITAASARIGFLVNPDYVSDNTMLYYQRSSGYSSKYTKLRGTYGTPDTGFTWHSSGYKFTVYEPNGDLHEDKEDNAYYITKPVGYDGENAVYTDISDRLTVQLSNKWRTEASSLGASVEDIFQTAIAGKSINSPKKAYTTFYDDYLQGQIMPYVIKGDFMKNTSSLYTASAYDKVEVSSITTLDKAGATDDVSITVLEKDVPQRIRMFIWLEGQDIDCTESIENVEFALSIELAGSNKKEE